MPIHNDAADGAIVPCAGGQPRECWVHVALFYDRPFRPTFLVLQRDPTNDDGNLLALSACKAPGSQHRAYWATMWEVFGDILDYKATSLVLQWYELKAVANKRVLEVRANRLRAEALPIRPMDLRAMQVDSRSGRRANRRRNNGGPGQGGRGRPGQGGRGRNPEPIEDVPRAMRSRSPSPGSQSLASGASGSRPASEANLEQLAGTRWCQLPPSTASFASEAPSPQRLAIGNTQITFRR